MAIYITGDTHGGIDEKKLYSKNFPNYKECTQDDFLIITGDFGYIFCNENDSIKMQKEINLMNKVFKNRKFGTVLFVDGNHENCAKRC